MRKLLAGLYVGAIIAGFATFGIWHARNEPDIVCDREHTAVIGDALLLAGCRLPRWVNPERTSN